jgi:hypothetical protein
MNVLRALLAIEILYTVLSARTVQQVLRVNYMDRALLDISLPPPAYIRGRLCS